MCIIVICIYILPTYAKWTKQLCPWTNYSAIVWYSICQPSGGHWWHRRGCKRPPGSSKVCHVAVPWCHGAMVIGPTHPLEKSHDFAVLGMAGNSICTCCGVVEHDDWRPTKYILDRQWSTSIHTLRCHSGPDASLSTQNAVRTAGACCRSVNWPWVVLASFRCCGVKHEMWEMEVSWNGGTPKWMVYSGKAY